MGVHERIPNRRIFLQLVILIWKSKFIKTSFINKIGLRPTRWNARLPWELFYLVFFWNMLSNDIKNLRCNLTYCEEIIKAMRFPLMTIEEFASFVPDTNLLNLWDKITVLFKFFAIKTSPVAFSKVPRRKLSDSYCRLGGFQSVRVGGCSYGSDGTSHSLTFSVDGNITLKGICLLGCENNTYTVTLTLNEINTGKTVISKTGKCSSTLLKCKDLSSVTDLKFCSTLRGLI